MFTLSNRFFYCICASLLIKVMWRKFCYERKINVRGSICQCVSMCPVNDEGYGYLNPHYSRPDLVCVCVGGWVCIAVYLCRNGNGIGNVCSERCEWYVSANAYLCASACVFSFVTWAKCVCQSACVCEVCVFVSCLCVFLDCLCVHLLVRSCEWHASMKAACAWECVSAALVFVPDHGGHPGPSCCSSPKWVCLFMFVCLLMCFPLYSIRSPCICICYRICDCLCACIQICVRGACKCIHACFCGCVCVPCFYKLSDI